MHIARPYARLRNVVPWSGSCRFVSREEALGTWPAVYEEVRRETPGMISRSHDWWACRHLPEQEWPHGPYSSSFLVQYEEEGRPRGYVRYRIHEQYEQGSANSQILVVELVAATGAAYSALWSYLFGVDLIGAIACDWARVDEPLLHMLEDPRRLIRRTQDTLWVRLVDVPHALATRRYATPGRLVLAVRDAFCPWNEGTYVLEAGTEGAACGRTAASADIEIEASALGALYLGGQRLRSLARAGIARGSTEALQRADAMFSWDPAPWIPEIF